MLSQFQRFMTPFLNIVFVLLLGSFFKVSFRVPPSPLLSFLLYGAWGLFFEIIFWGPLLTHWNDVLYGRPLEGSEAGNLDLVKSRDLARIPSHKHPIPAYYEAGPSEHMGTVGIQGNLSLRGQWGFVPITFWRYINSYPTSGGRLCPFSRFAPTWFKNIPMGLQRRTLREMYRDR